MQKLPALLYIRSFLHQTTTNVDNVLEEIELYIRSFLHQTTTWPLPSAHGYRLYIRSFLHQTTTTAPICFAPKRCISVLFYIKPQLTLACCSINNGCISVLFYIKPQPPNARCTTPFVVYPFFSTSNHNHPTEHVCEIWLYIRSFLHQTTTRILYQCVHARCISVLFYIKPQQRHSQRDCSIVVYPFFSTSNHNSCCTWVAAKLLYIRSFLHQTTSRVAHEWLQNCCISVLFYIKPQLNLIDQHRDISCISVLFYIKPQRISTDLTS